MSNAIGATPDTKYYLRFTDASGQVYSTDGGSLFAVTNVQFGASNSGGPPSTSSASAGGVTLSNLSFTLGSSSLTTKLDQMLESGTSWSNVELLGFDGSSLAVDDSFRQAIGQTDSLSIDGLQQSAVHNVSLAYSALKEKVIAPGSSGTSTSASWNQITNLPTDTTKVLAVSKPSASYAATKLDATAGGTSLSDVANTGVSSAADRVVAQFTTDGTVIGQSNGAQGWVDVASASFDQSQLLGPSDPSGAGKVSFGDLDLKVSAGSLEPLLFQDLTNGTGISVKLAVYGASGALTDSYDFSLASIVSAISADANGDQSYSIKFDDERSRHYAPGASQPATAGWNQITNTADVASPVTKAIALSGSPVRSAAVTNSTVDGFPEQAPADDASLSGATPNTKYYLRFTDTSGQVYSADAGSLFAVTNVQFGASNVGGPSSASGASAGKVTLSNLSFTLGSSSLTTKLDQMLESGTSWSDVELLGFDGSSLAIDDSFKQAIDKTDSVSIDGWNQFAVHNVSMAYGTLQEQVIAPGSSGTSTSASWNQITNLPADTTKVFAVSKPSASNAATKLDATTGGTSLSDVANTGVSSAANRVLAQFTTDGTVIGQSNGAQGWVDVASASFDQSQLLGLSNPSGAGKVSFGDLDLKLSAGLLEPLLFQDLTNGTGISVKLAVYGGSGTLTDSYDFSLASIASAISADANADQSYSITMRSEPASQRLPVGTGSRIPRMSRRRSRRRSLCLARRSEVPRRPVPRMTAFRRRSQRVTLLLLVRGKAQTMLSASPTPPARFSAPMGSLCLP
jgi:type VI protein secretion system component Hcp